ncbi:MAG: hypothetical protein ABSA76_04415 [Bacteroidales bacterium]
MKTFALTAVCGIIFTINLTGQIDKNHNLFSDQKNDSLKITPYSGDHTYGKLYKKFDLPNNKSTNPDLDLGEKHFYFESPALKRFNDKILAKKFPGSDRFYAKRGHKFNPAEKSFIIKPDTISKYYLIIKDSITNKVIN